MKLKCGSSNLKFSKNLKCLSLSLEFWEVVVEDGDGGGHWEVLRGLNRGGGTKKIRWWCGGGGVIMREGSHGI